MLIKKTWAIVGPSQPLELITSEDLRTLKFVQLLMSKSVGLTLKESVGLRTRPGQESDLHHKVNLVYKIITDEVNHINGLCLQKQKEWLQVELLDSVKEFVDIVGLSDELVDTTYASERKNLLRFQEYCDHHKSFVFQTLYNIDYTQDYDQIKKIIVDTLKSSENDSKFVFVDLSNELLKKIKNDQRF